MYPKQNIWNAKNTQKTKEGDYNYDKISQECEIQSFWKTAKHQSNMKGIKAI